MIQWSCLIRLCFTLMILSLFCLQVCVVIGVLLFFVYMYYCMDHLHFHVLNAYANVGVSHAQHHVAHKYLNGERHRDIFLAQQKIIIA